MSHIEIIVRDNACFDADLLKRGIDAAQQLLPSSSLRDAEAYADRMTFGGCADLNLVEQPKSYRDVILQDSLALCVIRDPVISILKVFGDGI